MAFKVDGMEFDPGQPFGLDLPTVPVGYWAVAGVAFGDEPVRRAEVVNPDDTTPIREVPGSRPLEAWRAVFTVAVSAWTTREARAEGRKPVRQGTCTLQGGPALEAVRRVKAGENCFAVAYDVFAAGVAKAKAGPLAEFKGMERVD